MTRVPSGAEDRGAILSGSTIRAVPSAGGVEAPTRAAAAAAAADAAASRTARCRAADGKLVCPRCQGGFS